MGTPYQFDPPAGCVLLVDEVGERPYRLRRLLTQLQQAGVFARARAVVIGQLPRCDEPGGGVTGRDVMTEAFRDFPGPVLSGFPTGHTTSALLTVPLGIDVRVVGRGTPGLVFEVAAAA
jgi:muramoyltetrapeptide carboxypeptidase